MKSNTFLVKFLSAIVVASIGSMSFADESDFILSNRLAVGTTFEVTQDIVFEPGISTMYFADDTGYRDTKIPGILARHHGQICGIKLKDNGDMGQRRRIKDKTILNLTTPPKGSLLDVRETPLATTFTEYIINSTGVESITCYIATRGSEMPTLQNVRTALQRVMQINLSPFKDIK